MSESTFLTREPVVNKKRAITANRLIAHGPSIASAIDALNNVSDIWPSHHTVFVSLARLVPTEQLLDWVVPPQTMLEIPCQALANTNTQALLPELRNAGVDMCLSWYTPGAPLPDQSDWRFVLVDARKTNTPGNPPGIPLAWGLSSLEAFQAAIREGFEGASGWFFLKSTQKQTKELSPAHAQIVRLLNLVRNNADIRDIETLLKQDVAISYKLLRFINSAGFGLMCEIQSFRHAVSILGYDALNKWLSLLLITASRDPSAPAMMQTSIARGRFMEEIGRSLFGANELDNLFITGAFSLLPMLLGTSMQGVLDEMSLPEPVTDALLYNEGPYAPFLALAQACESFDPAPLQKQAAELQLEASAVNRALVTALGFADSLQN